MAREVVGVTKLRPVEGSPKQFTTDVVIERRVFGSEPDVRRTGVTLTGRLVDARPDRPRWGRRSGYVFTASTGESEPVAVQTDPYRESQLIRARSREEAATVAANTYIVFELRMGGRQTDAPAGAETVNANA